MARNKEGDEEFIELTPKAVGTVALMLVPIVLLFWLFPVETIDGGAYINRSDMNWSEINITMEDVLLNFKFNPRDYWGMGEIP